MVTDRRGQAMVEFALAVFAFALIASAAVSFALLSDEALRLESDLRAEAGREALGVGIGSTLSGISGWDAGADGIPHTADDVENGGNASAAMTDIARRGLPYGRSAEWAYSYSVLPQSLMDMRDVAPAPVTYAERENAVSVEVDDLAAEYIFGTDEAKTSDRVAIPMTGGLL